jgi:hypothetical protein
MAKPCNPTPEAKRILRAMAKAQLEMGVTEPEAIISAIHDRIADFAPMSRAEIADTISGFGQKPEPRTKPELQQRMGQLKKDLRAAYHPNAKAEAKDAIRQRALKNEIADIEQRLKNGNYKKSAREKPEYTPETNKLQANVERARRRIDEAVAQAEFEKSSKYKRALRSVASVYRGSILLSLGVFEHLAGASAWRVVSTLFEDATWSAMRHLPPFRRLDEMAIMEGGSHLGSHWSALKSVMSKDTIREMGQKMVKGWTDRELMYGKDKVEPHGKLWLFPEYRQNHDFFNYPLVDTIGKSHGATKIALERYAYTRAFVRTNKNLRSALARQGKSAEEIDRTMVTDSSLAFQNDIAYAESQSAKLQGDNAVVNTYNNALRTLEQSGNIGATVAALAKIETPIVKIPMNYASEVFSYLAGAAKAGSKSARVGERMRQGGGDMTHAEADYIVRNIKKQTVGVGLFALGALGADYLGGLYRPDKKPLNKGLGYGDVKTPAGTLSHHWMHSAFTAIPQMGAMTVKIMAEDRRKARDNAALSGALDGFGQAVFSVLFDIPVMPIPHDIDTAAHGEFRKLAGEKARGFIPAELQRQAKIGDTPEGADMPTKRYPRNFEQELQLAIPGHGLGPIPGRKDVPTKPPRLRR